MGENSGQISDNATKPRGGIENLTPWPPGHSGNPLGRPVGQKNYATLYREALLKLAKANNVEPDALELEIIANALLNARNGNYKFFKDTMDRLFGKAVQPIMGQFNHQVETIADLISKVEEESAKNAKTVTNQPQPESAPEKEEAPASPVLLLPAPTEAPLDPASKPAFQLPTE